MPNQIVVAHTYTAKAIFVAIVKNTAKPRAQTAKIFAKILKLKDKTMDWQRHTELDLVFIGTYTPPRREVLYPLNEAEPAEPAGFEIKKVQTKAGVDITDLYFDLVNHYRLNDEAILENIIEQFKD